MNRSILLASFCVLAAACGTAPVTARIIAAEGGTVVAGSHQIVIPAASLPTDTEVTLTTAPATDYLPLAGSRPEVLVMQPEGTILELASEVTIEASFIGAAATDTVTVHQLQMVDGSRWLLLPSERGASGDVTVSVTRFAPLAIVVTTAGAGGGISGSLRWADGSAVPMVTVQLFAGDVAMGTSVTDANGRYVFEGLAAGSYRIVVMSECNIDRATTVTDGMVTTLDLTLCGT